MSLLSSSFGPGTGADTERRRRGINGRVGSN